jgi:hypothetical protein
MLPALVVGFPVIIMHSLIRANPQVILAIFIAGFLLGEHYNLGLWGRNILLVLLGLYAWLKAFDWLKRNRAANNVILAKYTFSQLSESEKQRVHNHAVEIINRSGGRFTQFHDETSQYGWYALSFYELGIPPAIPSEKNWLDVRNPFIAIFPSDPMLKAVSEFYRKRHGVQVEISRESTLSRTKD